MKRYRQIGVFLILALTMVACGEGGRVRSMESQPDWIGGGLVDAETVAQMAATMFQINFEDILTEDPTDLMVVPAALIQIMDSGDGAQNVVLNRNGAVFESFDVPADGFFEVKVQAPPQHAPLLTFPPLLDNVSMTVDGEECWVNAVDHVTETVQIVCP